jgi:hypothetical protein
VPVRVLLQALHIRVAVVQPGIIDIAMARRIEEAPTEAANPQVRRFGHMFEASLEKPTPPTIVAEKIREIIESGTQKLRHPVGPDAEGFLGWRTLSPRDGLTSLLPAARSFARYGPEQAIT